MRQHATLPISVLRLAFLLAVVGVWTLCSGLPAKAESRLAQALAPVAGTLRVGPYRGEAVVLMYHHISPRPDGASSITPAQFRAHMEYLKEAGFTVVSMATMWRVAFPALPAVIPGQGFRANMKCPACGERGWLTVSLRK